MTVRSWILLTTLALLAACAPQEAEPTEGGRIVIGTSFPVSGWNEYTAGDIATVRWLRRIYEPLAVEVHTGAPGETSFEPRLAESWSFDDGRTRLTFTLREATWSDGEPITAEDVLFTFEAQTSPEVNWGNADTKKAIASVELDPDDPRRVTFVFERPGPFDLADAIEGGILPEHVMGTVPFSEWHSHDWSEAARIGSGPFLLADTRPGEFILTRNPTLSGERAPRLDEVVVRVIDEPSVLMTQLRTGELHLVDQLAPRDALRIEGEADVELVEFALNDVAFIGWNTARPPFDDPRVRRAMALAIDRGKVVEELLLGFGEQSNGLVPPTSRAALPGDPLPHDLTEARRLLAEAGFGPDNPLSFELKLGSGNALREEIATKIQAQLADAGVEAKLRTMETRAMMGDVVGGDFDAFMRGLAIFGHPPIAAVFGTEAPYNLVKYSSRQVDEAVLEMNGATDWESFKASADRVQSVVREEQPMTFLYVRNGVAAHAANVEGVRFDAAGDPMLRLDRFRLR